MFASKASFFFVFHTGFLAVSKKFRSFLLFLFPTSTHCQICNFACRQTWHMCLFLIAVSISHFIHMESIDCRPSSRMGCPCEARKQVNQQVPVRRGAPDGLSDPFVRTLIGVLYGETEILARRRCEFRTLLAATRRVFQIDRLTSGGPAIRTRPAIRTLGATFTGWQNTLAPKPVSGLSCMYMWFRCIMLPPAAYYMCATIYRLVTGIRYESLVLTSGSAASQTVDFEELTSTGVVL
ncbi:hypothetical protein QBC45DRAFT_18922 [Copromyces sp. CBS 386.78]|nr:hypothetical protein QBC45DRAFT_18922 [Copromyces sp. CBS 386.78]